MERELDPFLFCGRDQPRRRAVVGSTFSNPLLEAEQYFSVTRARRAIYGIYATFQDLSNENKLWTRSGFNNHHYTQAFRR